MAILDWARCKAGSWLYYLGYRMMPIRIRKRVSQINAIGLAWIEQDFPKRFEITLEDNMNDLNYGQGDPRYASGLWWLIPIVLVLYTAYEIWG